MKKKSRDTGKGQNTSILVVPDDPAQIDGIGYDHHGQALVDMIRSVDAQGSFTFGIYGASGQGKTSMLRQIKTSLDSKDQANANILTAWFNPWRFTDEKHLIVPFFHTLTAVLKDKLKEKKGVSFWKKLSRVPEALVYGLETELSIPFLAKFKWDASKSFDRAREAETELENQARLKIEKAMDDHHSLYYDLVGQLETAKGLGLKIVVFVDDLDRCLPEKAVALLEGLKVMLDLPCFVFVIGVALEVVEAGVRVRYREIFKDGWTPFPQEKYLEKIIQFPMTLPPPDPERLRKHLLGKELSGQAAQGCTLFGHHHGRAGRQPPGPEALLKQPLFLSAGGEAQENRGDGRLSHGTAGQDGPASIPVPRALQGGRKNPDAPSPRTGAGGEIGKNGQRRQ